jgi:hypothetical protein
VTETNGIVISSPEQGTKVRQFVENVQAHATSLGLSRQWNTLSAASVESAARALLNVIQLRFFPSYGDSKLGIVSVPDARWDLGVPENLWVLLLPSFMVRM